MTNTNSFGEFSGEGHLRETGTTVYGVGSDGTATVHIASEGCIGRDDLDISRADHIRGPENGIVEHVRGLGWIASQ